MSKRYTFDDNDYLVEIEEKRKNKYKTVYKKEEKMLLKSLKTRNKGIISQGCNKMEGRFFLIDYYL